MRKLYLTRDQIDRIKDYASVFGSEAGQRVLKDMEMSFDRDVFVKGDPYETHVKIGERNVILRIRQLLEMSQMEIVEVRENEQEIWNEL